MKILCIDGGGVFGFIPSFFIANACKTQPFPKFDCFGGTSVGSQLASSYASGKTPSEVDLFFRKQVNTIFSRTFFSKLNPFGAKFSDDGLNSSLKEWFGSTQLLDVEKYLIIPTYDFRNSKPKIYDNIDLSEDLYEPLWQACRKSSSAPTYFSPFEGFIDGGLIANNPIMVTVWALHSKLGVPFEEMEILSIGTGKSHVVKNADKGASKWTKLGWLNPMLNLLTEGNEMIFEFGAKQVPFKKYYRINPIQLKEDWEMDNIDLIPMLEELCLPHINQVQDIIGKFND